jgi:small-conductance mechanosensitive channel
MGARYTSVDSRDGREFLIPNEDFVTQRVVNWSYSNDLVRLDVTFGTTYASDPRKTQNAAIAAARSVDQVLPQPPPLCHLTAFGTVAIEFMLLFWIKNHGTDIASVRGAVMLALWDTLEREGIGIPKPGATRVILEQTK